MMRDDLTRTREAAEALKDLPNPSAATQPLMAFLADRAAFIDRRAQQIRDNPNAPIRFDEDAARDHANADMVSIEFAAIRFFSAVGSKEGLELVARTTRDSDVRNDADAAISRWAPPLPPDEAIERHIRELGFPIWSIRVKAAEALGKLRDARAVEPLINCLKDDEFWVVQAAADALALIGDVRAVEPLEAALERYKVGKVGKNIVEALEKLRGRA